MGKDQSEISSFSLSNTLDSTSFAFFKLGLNMQSRVPARKCRGWNSEL